MTKRYDSARQWYTLQVSSGYEEKVETEIRRRIDGVDMADKIFDVMVPKEKTIEIKNGRRKTLDKKIFQGYVFVEAKLTEEVWYILRNTPGVTGFVGAGNDPTPVNEREIREIRKRMGKTEATQEIDFSVGEVVNVIDGPFKGFEGNIEEVDHAKGKLRVLISMFGRDTSVELDALQVKKVD
ncbi:MAG: transcription termination/antitermination protein NusG [Candidatus Nomurabacteria bacterium]|jgi:transcriptional antiterminator NusG|nr:transcription termination/antitermination protein NusG [Candidatus Nomurabacteria bacterium]